MIKFFTEKDIREKVSMKEAIGLMKEAFVQLSTHAATVPIRTLITTPDELGCALYMPSYSPAYQLFGLKMVSVFDKNVGMPAIQGNMLIMDGKNGTPLALLEAEYLTALRTGAASGLATELLSQEDAHVLAIFGTGIQAETQLEGVINVREIRRVIVFGRTAEHVTSFCKRLSEKFSIGIHPAKFLDELKQADIICTATTSLTPVFESTYLKSRVHINGVGSFKPTMQEIPSEVIKNACLVVDQYETALTEAGDILIPIAQGVIDKHHIRAELGEIISGYKKGKTQSDQITVFKSVGNAIQDLAIASALV